MLKKNLSLKTLAFVVIIGIPTLFFLGAIYDLLSAREWAIGMIAWAAVLGWGAEASLASRAEPCSR